MSAKKSSCAKLVLTEIEEMEIEGKSKPTKVPIYHIAANLKNCYPNANPTFAKIASDFNMDVDDLLWDLLLDYRNISVRKYIYGELTKDTPEPDKDAPLDIDEILKTGVFDSYFYMSKFDKIRSLHLDIAKIEGEGKIILYGRTAFQGTDIGGKFIEANQNKKRSRTSRVAQIKKEQRNRYSKLLEQIAMINQINNNLEKNVNVYKDYMKKNHETIAPLQFLSVASRFCITYPKHNGKKFFFRKKVMDSGVHGKYGRLLPYMNNVKFPEGEEYEVLGLNTEYSGSGISCTLPKANILTGESTKEDVPNWKREETSLWDSSAVKYIKETPDRLEEELDNLSWINTSFEDLYIRAKKHLIDEPRDFIIDDSYSGTDWETTYRKVRGDRYVITNKDGIIKKIEDYTDKLVEIFKGQELKKAFDDHYKERRLFRKNLTNNLFHAIGKSLSLIGQTHFRVKISDIVLSLVDALVKEKLKADKKDKEIEAYKQELKKLKKEIREYSDDHTVEVDFFTSLTNPETLAKTIPEGIFESFVELCSFSKSNILNTPGANSLLVSVWQLSGTFIMPMLAKISNVTQLRGYGAALCHAFIFCSGMKLPDEVKFLKDISEAKFDKMKNFDWTEKFLKSNFFLGFLDVANIVLFAAAVMDDEDDTIKKILKIGEAGNGVINTACRHAARFLKLSQNAKAFIGGPALANFVATAGLVISMALCAYEAANSKSDHRRMIAACNLLAYTTIFTGQIMVMSNICCLVGHGLMLIGALALIAIYLYDRWHYENMSDASKMLYAVADGFMIENEFNTSKKVMSYVDGFRWFNYSRLIKVLGENDKALKDIAKRAAKLKKEGFEMSYIDPLAAAAMQKNGCFDLRTIQSLCKLEPETDMKKLIETGDDLIAEEINPEFRKS